MFVLVAICVQKANKVTRPDAFGLQQKWLTVAFSVESAWIWPVCRRPAFGERSCRWVRFAGMLSMLCWWATSATRHSHFRCPSGAFPCGGAVRLRQSLGAAWVGTIRLQSQYYNEILADAELIFKIVTLTVIVRALIVAGRRIAFFALLVVGNGFGVWFAGCIGLCLDDDTVARRRGRGHFRRFFTTKITTR